jgi:hypothetical protein
MASIIDIYTKTPPKTGKINTKGTDKMPIESKKETDAVLTKARHGKLNTATKYSDMVKK